MKFRMTLAAREPLLKILSDVGEVPAESVRDRMLAAFRAGNLHRLKFSATVWTDGPNKNHYRFPPEELKAFAASFAGMPFLKDHAPMQDSRGGTILESELIEGADGRQGIRQRIEAVKPWAVESALDGTLDRFSVGWDAEEYLCTVCKADILSDDCKHGPWKLGTKDEKTGEIVELLWKGISGVEVSAVTHPAAPGTTTEEVMAALAQLKERRPPVLQTSATASGNPPGANVLEVLMLERLLRLLNLPANTSEPDALSALEARLSKEPGVPKPLCTALGLPESASESEVVGKVVAMSAPGAFVSKAEHDRVAGELADMKASEKVRGALASGKLTPAMEPWALGLAKANPAAFDAFIEHAPKQVPLPSSGTVKPDTTAPKTDTLSEEARFVMSRMGVNEEEYLAVKRAESARSN